MADHGNGVSDAEIAAGYRAGRARQGAKAAPEGGGFANGGRVAKAAFGAKQRHAAAPVEADAAPMAGLPFKRGGRVKGC